MEHKKIAWKAILPYLCLSLCLLVLLFLNAFYLDHWLDSDMAAEMIFSKLIAEQGRWIAPTGWFYSTEFRILYTQLFMAPLFHLSDNWHLIRLITNFLTYGLLLASYFYLMKQTRAEKHAKVWGAVLLLLPFSETMMLHMHMGNTYLFHVILIFFALGLFLSLYEDGKAGRSGVSCIVKGVILAVLSLILGMSGVRYFMSYFAPLLIALFILWLRSEGVSGWKKLHLGEEMQEKELLLKSFQEESLGKAFVMAVIISLIALIGYVINGKVIRKLYFFQTYDSTDFVDVYEGNFLERLQDTFGSLLMLFGYIPGKSVLSLRGIITLCALAAIVVVFMIFLRVRKNVWEEKSKERLLITFASTAFLISAFTLLFTTSTNVPRYFIPSVIFFAPAFALYLSRENHLMHRRVSILLMVLCFGLLTLKADASMVSTDKNADRRVVTKWLTDNGYTFGYATYWNANITQELSNGQIRVANILDPESMGFFKWSSEEAYYLPAGDEGSKVPAGKVFLLLTTDQERTYRQAPAIKNGEKAYVDDAFAVYSYESAEELLQYQVQ